MSLVGFVVVQAEDKLINWITTTHLLQESHHILFVVGWSDTVVHLTTQWIGS